MAGSGVMFAKNWMMNDGGCHELQSTKSEAQSTKRPPLSSEPYDIETVSAASSNKSRVRGLGMMFANVSMQDKVSGGQGMKRLLALILVLTLLVFAGTLVSADGKTSAVITNSNLDKSIEQTEAK